MNIIQPDMHEKELVIRLINGDEEAFCELYANYKNRLIYFAMKFVKSYEFAEDIFQDVFAAVWQSRRVIDPEQSFSSYLYTIIRNRMLNLIRNIQQEEKLRNHILSQSIDYDEETGRKVLFDDLNLIINKSLESLTPRQREIFKMSREEEMSHKEIAEKLNLSVYTVQEHISLSLKSIKTFLSKYPEQLIDLFLILICLNM
ncbi:RNA polymerase sigma-70 factor [Petrimonas sp.]|uniref:RNA polymerase sigma-70 factor n=1 Tax=Petrimonas sp. TaxID=2023866 RepID=UPI000961C317|nr:RNA polymerase sigma-70 factor [Petrimonas sp.]OJV35510.1 MAG: RNA polymerase subunit sigma-70 [Bacteroidia bacterium 43-41]